MIKALQLIFEPATAWDAIARAERGVFGVLIRFLLPAVLIACSLEGWGMLRLGHLPTRFGLADLQTVTLPLEVILRFEIAQAGLNLAAVFLLAYFLHQLLRSFHCRAPFALALTVMAYNFAPLLVMQMIDGIPLAPTWLCRGIGALLAAKVFYVGLVRVIRPEPSTALGLYFLGALLIFAFAGISHFVALQILEGRLLAGLGVALPLLR